MKINRSIQLKAAFLLVVFAMNTLVGFACAVGLDMGFNKTHHQNEEATESAVHVHANGHKHEHHAEAPKQQHDKKDDCCNDKVIKFQNLDKNLTQNSKTAVDAPVFTAILSNISGIEVFNPVTVVPVKYISRYFHPPPADILILVQRFQI
jgi:hypothetical protein